MCSWYHLRMFVGIDFVKIVAIDMDDCVGIDIDQGCDFALIVFTVHHVTSQCWQQVVTSCFTTWCTISWLVTIDWLLHFTTRYIGIVSAVAHMQLTSFVDESPPWTPVSWCCCSARWRWLSSGGCYCGACCGCWIVVEASGSCLVMKHQLWYTIHQQPFSSSDGWPCPAELLPQSAVTISMLNTNWMIQSFSEPSNIKIT